MTGPFIIAVPAKGRLQENAARFFSRAGLELIKPRGAREEDLRVLLQPAFGRHRDHERRAHATPRNAASRSIQTAKPTAGIGFALPSRASSPS